MNRTCLKKAGLDTSTESLERISMFKRAQFVVFKNFLSICLLSFVTFGIFVPKPGVFFSELPTHYICIVLIFFHSGLKLKTGELKDALRSFKALLWGIVCILFVTPVLGGKITGLLPYVSVALPTENGFATSTNHSMNNVTQSTPATIVNNLRYDKVLGPALFQTSMQIYFIAPCTISAGVILVRIFVVAFVYICLFFSFVAVFPIVVVCLFVFACSIFF